MNNENLKTPTPKQARERGRKGGIASGQARREKKAFREAFNELLETTHEHQGEKGTGIELIAAAIFKQALEGDIKAAGFIRDTTEGRPPAKLNEYTEDKEQYEKEQRDKMRKQNEAWDFNFLPVNLKG